MRSARKPGRAPRSGWSVWQWGGEGEAGGEGSTRAGILLGQGCSRPCCDATSSLALSRNQGTRNHQANTDHEYSQTQSLRRSIHPAPPAVLSLPVPLSLSCRATGEHARICTSNAHHSPAKESQRPTSTCTEAGTHCSHPHATCPSSHSGSVAVRAPALGLNYEFGYYDASAQGRAAGRSASLTNPSNMVRFALGRSL